MPLYEPVLTRIFSTIWHHERVIIYQNRISFELNVWWGQTNFDQNLEIIFL